MSTFGYCSFGRLGVYHATTFFITNKLHEQHASFHSKIVKLMIQDYYTNLWKILDHLSILSSYSLKSMIHISSMDLSISVQTLREVDIRKVYLL
jgi:hypothetical protein